MHVALVGAGDLGRVLGVRLAVAAGLDVSFVTRRGGALGPLAIERVGRRGERLGLPDVVALREPPAHADALVVTVRAEQLDALLEAPWLRSSEAPVLCLTPLLPLALERVKGRLGARLAAAMPNVMAYRREGLTRYWLSPRLVPMRVEAPKGPPPEPVARLVAALDRAGFAARFELGTEEMNAATTVAALPLYMLPACGRGGLAEALADDELSSLAFRALAETRRLARHVGQPAPGASPLLALARPWQLRALARLGPSAGGEVAAFWDEHFGHKLAAQHRAMAHQVLALARRLGVLLPNFAALTARLPAP
ncbi:MAG TPA: 2-dehydropantoate 2-reductase N-terminal domain-containing protein [Polyangiaceae bacterium]|nr:2-dehydropantoate 2-reductase N-terminal domain-containing protein [Polyangiaceae bacterium]